MSRFANLEFGDEEKQSSQPVTKDGAFYLNEAQEFFRAGRFDQALRSYSKVLEYAPECGPAWTGQVQMLIELGEYREAKLWADKALEKFPHEPELVAAKAVALAREGDTKAALIFSDAAIEMPGNSPYVWLARGDVLLARSENRAEFCFEKAFGMAPQDWLWRWMTSRVYYWYKQFSRAFKAVQEGLQLDAGQAVLWAQFGKCQLALGLGEAAARSFEQARQIDPQFQLAEADHADLISAPLLARLRGWLHKLTGR